MSALRFFATLQAAGISSSIVRVVLELIFFVALR
jgi:hypothetical protein